ncbi:MAG: hypothetical protein ACI85O_001992 [Saprospiraceae bacterium]|jgi:hypothetical protein
MRPLSKQEESRLRLLTKNSISVTLIEPTKNGLKKSIMDATGVVRSYFKENGIHDYQEQKKGPEGKIFLAVTIYDEVNTYKSKVSLYRPKTKKGDPRIWFYGLTKYVNPNDIIAITYHDDELHVFNMSILDIDELLYSGRINPLKELINDINGDANEIALELLNKLKKVANEGLIPSMVNADTAVGRTLERVLGIEINSSKQPDYKGIEIKSFRSKRKTRKNLFAQVPDWSLSQFKSSAQILDAFGYWREEDFKLYCTVSTIVRNSQGLNLRLDTDIQQLIENSDRKAIGDFAVWSLAKLHKRLLAKHRETFWVAADSVMKDGREFFQYTVVEHTKKPIISQFDLLIEQGIITLDHLIKRNSKGSVVEKGPIFKIKPNGTELLFPPSEKYYLIA